MCCSRWRRRWRRPRASRSPSLPNPPSPPLPPPTLSTPSGSRSARPPSPSPSPTPLGLSPRTSLSSNAIRVRDSPQRASSLISCQTLPDPPCASCLARPPALARPQTRAHRSPDLRAEQSSAPERTRYYPVPRVSVDPKSDLRILARMPNVSVCSSDRSPMLPRLLCVSAVACHACI